MLSAQRLYTLFVIQPFSFGNQFLLVCVFFKDYPAKLCGPGFRCPVELALDLINFPVGALFLDAGSRQWSPAGFLGNGKQAVVTGDALFCIRPHAVLHPATFLRQVIGTGERLDV